MKANRNIGPLLRELAEAHRDDDEIVSYPTIRFFAAALQSVCRQLGDPIVWPVGPAAERLAGAAVLSSEGRVQVRGWSDSLRGARILLVTLTALTPIGLLAAAKQARALGAAEVHACGVAVNGLEESEVAHGLNSFLSLEIPRSADAMGDLKDGISATA